MLQLESACPSMKTGVPAAGGCSGSPSTGRQPNGGLAPSLAPPTQPATSAGPSSARAARTEPATAAHHEPTPLPVRAPCTLCSLSFSHPTLHAVAPSSRLRRPFNSCSPPTHPLHAAHCPVHSLPPHLFGRAPPPPPRQDFEVLKREAVAKVEETIEKAKQQAAARWDTGSGPTYRKLAAGRGTRPAARPASSQPRAAALPGGMPAAGGRRLKPPNRRRRPLTRHLLPAVNPRLQRRGRGSPGLPAPQVPCAVKRQRPADAHAHAGKRRRPGGAHAATRGKAAHVPRNAGCRPLCACAGHTAAASTSTPLLADAVPAPCRRRCLLRLCPAPCLSLPHRCFPLLAALPSRGGPPVQCKTTRLRTPHHAAGRQPPAPFSRCLPAQSILGSLCSLKRHL